MASHYHMHVRMVPTGSLAVPMEPFLNQSIASSHIPKCHIATIQNLNMCMMVYPERGERGVKHLQEYSLGKK